MVTICFPITNYSIFLRKKSTFRAILACLLLEQPLASVRINIYSKVNISGARTEFQSCRVKAHVQADFKSPPRFCFGEQIAE